jgi:phenylalanyl-tRNA synthetase beta chain
MKVPVSWLREYVDVDVPLPELAERLAIASCEVDRIVRKGVPDVEGNLDLYRVGHVVEAGKHPNADRLQLCRVDVGEGEPRQIVCGAWNFSTGATVAVALPGAVLPGGQRLERAQLRGEVSEGMILSERELELGTDHAGILVLEEPWEPGTPLADALPLVEDVLEIETTYNRPDLLAVYGIAREVAALYDVGLARTPGRDPEPAGRERLDISIEDFEGCPRYLGRLFRDVRIGPSPVWLRARLQAAGVRAISNVVDVTNYAMLALGSPLHAFDYDTLAGGRIVVRRARPGEELRTLDGTLRTLDPADLVIADAERPIAFAGVMGGEETEVKETTANVLLEAANFEPVGIMRTVERHGLRTEGSNRWEKGVDPYLAEQAAVLATELLVDLAGARWVAHDDVVGTLPERPVIGFRDSETTRLTGVEIPRREQEAILERLGFDVEREGTIVTPTWRARDVTREADLVEEVTRIYGLERVPFTLPLRSAMRGRMTKEQRLRRVVEDALVGAGFCEAYTSSLVPEDPHPNAIRLPDPLSSEQAVLRTTLLPSLISAAERNVHARNEDIALFEIARVYLPADEPLPDERWHLGGIVEGGFARAKGAVEVVHAALHLSPEVARTRDPKLHPGKAAALTSGAGSLGELHPRLLPGAWGVFELDLEKLYALVPERILYRDVITYPPLRQDLAFAVPEDVLAGDLAAAAAEAAGPELVSMEVFDVYRGEQVGPGRKSVAFRVAFQSPEGTLSDEDARELRERIVAALGERFGAELRAV